MNSSGILESRRKESMRFARRAARYVRPIRGTRFPALLLNWRRNPALRAVAAPAPRRTVAASWSWTTAVKLHFHLLTGRARDGADGRTRASAATHRYAGPHLFTEHKYTTLATTFVPGRAAMQTRIVRQMPVSVSQQWLTYQPAAGAVVSRVRPPHRKSRPWMQAPAALPLSAASSKARARVMPVPCRPPLAHGLAYRAPGRTAQPALPSPVRALSLEWAKSAAGPANTEVQLPLEQDSDNRPSHRQSLHGASSAAAVQAGGQVRATSLDPALAERLAQDVIRRVERSLRIERERRGH